MPEEVKKEQGGEPKAPEAKTPEPKVEGDETPEAKKAELESQVAGLRAEMERIRGNNREQAAEIAALKTPPEPAPAEKPDLMSQIGELPADEANQLLAQKVDVMEKQLAEAQDDKRHAALTAQIQDVQQVAKDYGFDPLTREELAALLEQTEQQGYSRLRVTWKEQNEAAIKEKLLLKGAAERKDQDDVGTQAASEAAAPSLNAVGQGESEEGKRMWAAAHKLGRTPALPSA